MEDIIAELNQKLYGRNKLQEAYKDILKLTTDEERVIFVMNLLKESNVVPQMHGKRKDAKKSIKFREQGNKIFLSKPLTSACCIDAIKMYTKSIAYAPYPSEQLSLAYGNRSAVLLKLRKFDLSIQDIDRALANPYPDNLRPKLYVRKIECLVAMKGSATEDAYKEAQHWLDKMSLNDDNQKKLTQKLNSMKSLSRKANSQKSTKTSTFNPTIKTFNSEVPCASDAVAVRYNKMFGRHVVATRKINPGDIISIEKPYSLMLTPDKVYTHCTNCLEVCWANIPCDYCIYAMYCSEKCKSTAWASYHDIECPIHPCLHKLDFTKLDLMCLRLILQAMRETNSIQELRDELKEVDESTDPRLKGFSKDGILEGDKHRSMLGLVTNTDKRSAKDLYRRAMDSAFTLYALSTLTNMFGSPLEKNWSALLKNPDVTFIGGLIMRYQQMVPSNLHSFTEEFGLEAVERGVAAMPFLSLINHSCSPNIERHSKSNYIVLSAMFPIQEGEQLFDNYGQHYAINPREERRAELLKQYNFVCDCLPCMEDWPLYYNLKSFKSMVKTKAGETTINNALRKFNSYVDLATEGDVLDKPYIIDDLFNMIRILYTHSRMPNEEMNNVVETLKRVYSLHGNTFQIPKF